MSWLTRSASRLRGLFARHRLERELDDEVRFHLEMQMEDNLRAGMSPREARLAALRSFGGAESMKDVYRDSRSFSAVETLFRDIGYALRTLRSNPSFTAIAVLSLALGIGANTAIFNVIDAVLLRELPVRDPRHLVQLVVPNRGDEPFETFPYPFVRVLASHRDIFSGIAGFHSSTFDAGPSGATEPTSCAWVTGGYYETLGIEPQLGRLLSPTDDQPGATPAAVLADAYWARRFHRDTNIVGQTIRIGAAQVVVVGVSPAGFTGVNVGQPAEITVTGAALPQIEPGYGSLLLRSNYRMLRIIARPRAGLSGAQAVAPLAALWPGVVEGSPFAIDFKTPPDLRPASTGWTDLRHQFARPLFILMTVVALVLLIACMNIANLMLARASAREREIALRLAIGASRGRIIRQLLTESLLLAAAGALPGLLLSGLTSRLVLDLLSSGAGEEVVLDLAPHPHVLLFVTFVGVATALLFGIVPAWRATAIGPAATLKDSSAQVSGSRSALAPVLVVLQVALSMVLLIGAGLLLSTLRNLRHFDAGFRHEEVLLVDLPKLNYSGDRLMSFFHQLTDRMERIRGVTAVSLSNTTVLTGSICYSVRIPGTSTNASVDFDRIGPRYFQAMGTRLVEGREFTIRDEPASPPVVIVNQSFARRFFPQPEGALGRLVTIESRKGSATVVGVVADARSHSFREPAVPAIYVPLFQWADAMSATFEVRAAGSLTDVAAALRRELRSEMQSAIVIRPLSERVEQTLLQERLMADLAAAFGGLALVLACIGIYGVVTYAVARRTREIGIRMALGAGRVEVLRMVVGRAATLLTCGVVLGLPAVWLISGWVSSLLFGLKPTDPATIATAAFLLVGCGLLAGLIPALRGARLDPTVALRYE